jgi:hypothetical protein
MEEPPVLRLQKAMKGDRGRNLECRSAIKSKPIDIQQLILTLVFGFINR